MIKAICFDLDGVYFTKQGNEQFKQAIIDLGVSQARMEYVLFECPEVTAFKKGRITKDEFWSFANSCWNLINPLTPDQRNRKRVVGG